MIRFLQTKDNRLVKIIFIVINHGTIRMHQQLRLPGRPVAQALDSARARVCPALIEILTAMRIS